MRLRTRRQPYRLHAAAPARRVLILSAAEVRKKYLWMSPRFSIRGAAEV
jgi:hypothetical protein